MSMSHNISCRTEPGSELVSLVSTPSENGTSGATYTQPVKNSMSMSHNISCRTEPGSELVSLVSTPSENGTPGATYTQPVKSDAMDFNLVILRVRYMYKAGAFRYYLTRLRIRIMYEVALLISSLPHLLPKILLLNWGAMMIFRNIAYMRHVQGPRLKDLGFELVPEVDNDFWSEMCLYVNGVLSTAMVLTPILLGDYAHARGIYTTNMYMKVLNIQCIGHVLRFLTFVSTSIPGPSSDCQVGANKYRDTISWYEVFTRRSRVHVDPNCGDLIFSGHMFQVTSFCAVILCEMSKLMPHKVIARIVSCLLISTVCLQPYFIIASRNHYSVDVVISSYLAPLVWYAMEGFYRTSFHQKGVIWFSEFVPSFIHEFLKAHDPSWVSRKEKDNRDTGGLQCLAQEYKSDGCDSQLLADIA